MAFVRHETLCSISIRSMLLRDSESISTEIIVTWMDQYVEDTVLLKRKYKNLVVILDGHEARSPSIRQSSVSFQRKHHPGR